MIKNLSASHSFPASALLAATLSLAVCACASAGPVALPPQVADTLAKQNVSWNTPGGELGSMPIGNGDVAGNVWVEANGDLAFYIAKSDAWSEHGRLLKVGR